MTDLIWQYEDGPNVWKAYSDEHTKLLTGALTSKSNTCDLKLPNKSDVTVDLEKGVQHQKGATRTASRKIRLVFVDRVNGKGFTWQVDLKPWSNMPPTAANQLEQSSSRGDTTANLTIGAGNAYTVDLKKMSQTNDSTGFRRNIRRLLLTDKMWKPQAPPAAAAKTSGADAPAAPPAAMTRRTSSRISTGSAAAAAAAATAATGASKRSAATAAAAAAESTDSEGDSVKRRKKQPSSSTAAGKTKKSRKISEDEEDNEDENKDRNKKATEKVVIVKGAAAVDSDLVGISAASVGVLAEGPSVYDAMLNQTNLQFNNNKFYLLQLLHKAATNDYWVWFRWGRVGKSGQHSLTSCGHDADRAKRIFCQKFSDKTHNEWSDAVSGKFQKVSGKYDLVQRDHKATDSAASSAASKAGKPKPDVAVASKLHEAVQALLNLICDIQQMQDTVVEMRYDAKRLPLGKLTPAQIKAGNAALKAIEELVRAGQASGQKLVAACNDFYTRIPHDFGMRVPPVIRSLEEVQEKADLLQALEQIQTALKVVSGGADDNSKVKESPLDGCYRRLACDIQPLGSDSDEFKLVNNYLLNTHGPTHNLYTLELVKLFKLSKEVEQGRFKSDMSNRILLWHGSRLTNWAGILSQGLRVAPPEAPATGYMFGKGVYFADVSSKSANYLYATRSKPTGLLALCEVALGTSREVTKADYGAAKLPAGHDSVKGLGELVPDPKSNVTLPDGCLVPSGKLVPSNSSTVLNYNEYVVYSVDQLRLKYLVQIKFKFK